MHGATIGFVILAVLREWAESSHEDGQYWLEPVRANIRTVMFCVVLCTVLVIL